MLQKIDKKNKKAVSIQTIVILGMVMLVVLFTFYIAFSKYESFKSIIGLS